MPANSAGRVLDAFLDRERASEINTQSHTQGVMKLTPSGNPLEKYQGTQWSG
jgi:hypothetical protein